MPTSTAPDLGTVASPFLLALRGPYQFGPGYFEPVDAEDVREDAHMRRDGEWYAVIRLPHEAVEFDGYHVPVFEGDVERREWEARRRR